MSWFARDEEKPGRHRLAKAELFSTLSERDLRIVDGFVHYRRFLAGEVIFDAGEDGQALYVIVRGKVAICLPGQPGTPLAELQTDDFFGELGLLDDEPRSAQVRASEPTEVAVLFRGDFERLMALHGRIASQIALQLARHLGRRLRRMLQQVATP